MRCFGIADQFSIQVRGADHIDIIFSPQMIGYVRDAAYHLVDDPAAGTWWDEPVRDLLFELGEALTEALAIVHARQT